MPPCREIFAGMFPLLLSLAFFTHAGMLWGAELGDISLEDAKGKQVLASELPAGKFTVFISAGTSCPVMRQYVPVLNGLFKKWHKKGVEFYLLGEAKQDDNAALQEEFRSFSVEIPVYFDAKQEFAKKHGLDVTSKVLVLSGSTREVVYSGAIDDRFGVEGRKNRAVKTYLDSNLGALLSGKKLPFPKTRAFGCAITLR
jgi:hypothetical protein